MKGKKLCKSRKNKMLGGVCGGLAEYLNMDPTVVRIITALLCVIRGAGVILYIVAFIIMPYGDEDFSEDDAANLKSANIDPEEEEKSRKSDSKLHSDEDFDSFFKNSDK